MFNEATFQEMPLPSLGKINDYVIHIYSKHADLNRVNRTCGSGLGEVGQCITLPSEKVSRSK